MRIAIRTTFLLLALMVFGRGSSYAQVDLSGNWAARMHEDWQDRFPGPDGGDFTGLPLNEDGRARALAYSTTQLSMPERQCAFYQPHYMEIGPFNLKFWTESDPVTGQIIAWQINGWTDRAPRTIWMDGRPHPSENAPHTNAGFSTGHWEGNTLVVRTTHMKAGPLRRNGAPASDDMVMTEFISRHGDVLTVMAVMDDPAYLSEPHVISRSWQLDVNLQGTPFGGTCVPVVEIPGIGLDGGAVPHYLPGQSPYAGEITKYYGIPQEVANGLAASLYPEYRKELVGKYSPPASCGRYCCGWVASADPKGDAPGLTCTSRSPRER